MKKVISFLAMIFFTLMSVVYASDFTPTKRVVIFYRVPDTVISCQNGEEDMVKGREEFEKTLRKNYEKRFIVDDIRPAPAEKETAKQYLARVKLGEVPIYVAINLVGQHTISQNWQNAFGATETTYAPAVDLDISEYRAYSDNKFHGYGPVALYWSPGAMPLGFGYGYITENNARKNTKNAIKYVIESNCTFHDNINKYTNPEAYNREVGRYNGDFEVFANPNPTEEQAKLNYQPL